MIFFDLSKEHSYIYFSSAFKDYLLCSDVTCAF